MVDMASGITRGRILSLTATTTFLGSLRGPPYFSPDKVLWLRLVTRLLDVRCQKKLFKGEAGKVTFVSTEPRY